jgi:hypothetical protein
VLKFYFHSVSVVEAVVLLCSQIFSRAWFGKIGKRSGIIMPEMCDLSCLSHRRRNGVKGLKEKKKDKKFFLRLFL